MNHLSTYDNEESLPSFYYNYNLKMCMTIFQCNNQLTIEEANKKQNSV